MERSSLTEVKAILKSLILSCPEKITIEKLNRDYRDVEGTFIPFRQLGYSNIEEFLRSIPDTLKVFGTGPTAMVCFVANEKSNHIHDMIMKQKKPKNKSVRTRSRSRHRRRGMHQRIDNNKFNSSYQDTKMSGHQLSPLQSINRSHITKTPKLWNESSVETTKSYNQPNPVHSPIGGNQLYSFPQPSGINSASTSQHLNNKTRTESNTPFNMVRVESKVDVKQLNGLLKNTCYITSPPPPLIRRKEIKVIPPMLETKDQTPKKLIATNHISNEIKTPRAVNLTASSKPKDKTRFGKYLNPIQDTFEEVYENERDVKEIKNMIDSRTKNLFDVSDEDVYDLDDAVPQSAARNNVFRLDFPEYSAPYGSKITPYKLSDDITVGSLIKIFITEIHNPYKFWFHIHKNDHELDLLMYQIERYYTVLDPDELLIPTACLTPDQICAACYNGMWHRAKIVAPPVNNTIKVSFMDYGTVTEIDIENIKLLASQFARLPAQALRGCLSHIKPRLLHWSHEATKYFLTLVSELLLYAQITEIDKEKKILYMILCNTNDDEIIQINKSLVLEQHALYSDEWKTDNINKNNGKRLHHPREDFPT